MQRYYQVKNEPINKNNDFSNEQKDEEEAISILKRYAEKDNMIKEGKLVELLKKFGSRSKDIINKLIDNNILIDTDGTYEILI